MVVQGRAQRKGPTGDDCKGRHRAFGVEGALRVGYAADVNPTPVKLLTSLALALFFLGGWTSGAQHQLSIDADNARLLDKASQGDADSLELLVFYYKHGLGVTKNEAEAVRWCRKAAELGHASAQFNLGNWTAAGEGILKNEAEAYKWLLLASAQGYERAHEAYAKLELKLTPTDRAEGQRMASEFRPRKGPPALIPAPPGATAQTRQSTTGSGKSTTSQGPIGAGWNSFVGYFCVFALVVAVVLHLRQGTTTGTKAALAPTASATPVQPQP